MSKRLQTYETPEITVTFDPEVCIHSGKCVRGLPGVFDVKRKRWIALEAASPDEIAAQVARCPSGALQATRHAVRYYHGTKADLQPGDLIEPGRQSNYGSRRAAKFVYFTATLDAATWGAELAVGDGRGRIFVVEPSGSFEDDPNLTDKRFPGNPTRSYRTAAPLRVTGEIAEWTGHTPEQLAQMHAHLEKLKAEGVEAIEE
ncbi:MAG: NAD(+)--rifampin ADP-ribosyltransferase [Gemmatimonadaceae bacterium]|nr:NAD(+)--rifampin ADP-ribosyltransferase [Gemmatimonadaceae bacterium]